MAGIGSHTKPNQGATDDWITPRAILDALPRFDLDPCECIPQPWPCAVEAYNRNQNGLLQPWDGRVWMNPPYGRQTAEWLARLAQHGNGIALIFARTETDMFHRYVWERADGILFLRGRLFFHRPDGSRAPHNAGGPSCLIAYGGANVVALAESRLEGKLVELQKSGGRKGY